MKRFFLIIAISSVMLCISCMKTMDVYTITVESNDSSLGTVSGGGSYVDGGTAVLTAKPNPGCNFVYWSKGSYSRVEENPYERTVSGDETWTAFFERNSSVRVKHKYGTSYYKYYYCQLDVNLKKLTCTFWLYQDRPYPSIELQFVWNGAITPGTFSDLSTIDFTYKDSYVVDFKCESISLSITSIDLDTKLISFAVDANCLVSSMYDWGETTSQDNYSISATDIPITF